MFSEIQTQDIGPSTFPTSSLTVPVSKHTIRPETETELLVTVTVRPTPDGRTCITLITTIFADTGNYFTAIATTTSTSSPFASLTYALASVAVLSTTTSINCLPPKSNSDSNAVFITLTVLLGVLFSIMVLFGIWFIKSGAFRRSEPESELDRDAGRFSASSGIHLYGHQS